jgi:hypothetical protein
MRGSARLPLLLLIVTLLPGCPAIQWYTRQSSKGAVRGFYEGMADLEQPLRGKALSNVLSDPALRQTAQDVTAAIVIGAIDGLTQAKITKLSEHLVHDSMQTLREQGGAAMNDFVDKSGPLLEQAMRRGIETSILALGESMRKTAQNDLGAATNLLVRSAIEGMMQALRQGGREALRDLSADTEQYLAQKVAPNAGLVARTVTREAMLGLQDGFTQSGMHDQLPALRMVMREIGIGLGEGLGQGLGRSVRKSPLEPILIGLSAGLTLLFVATVVWLILLWRRYAHITRSLINADPSKNSSKRLEASADPIP